MVYFTGRNVCVLAISLPLLFLGPLFSYSQELVTGFYIVMPLNKKCPNKLRTLDGRQSFCLPKELIISELEFENVGEVKYDSVKEFTYLLIKLTVEGFKTLKVLTQKLPDADIALVVDGKVAGVFENPDLIVNRIVSILGGKDPAEIEWIHDKLKRNPNDGRYRVFREMVAASAGRLDFILLPSGVDPGAH